MYQRIENTATGLSAFLLFVLMVITFVDVVGRNLFNHPLNGASELTEILLALVIFLMLPQVARRNQHIAIDLIENVVKPRGLVVLNAIASILGAVMFGLIAWRCWVLADKAIGYGDRTAALGIPVGPVMYVIAVLAGLVALASLLALPLSVDDLAARSEGTQEPVVS